MAGATRVVMVQRHCQTHLNATGRYQSTSDPRLDDTGRAHARRIGRSLAGIDLGAIVTSPSTRAIETANLLIEGSGRADVDVPVRRDERLAELDLGPFEGQSVSGVEGPLAEEFAAWRSIDDHRTPHGVEPLEAVATRASAVVGALDARVSLLVGHAFTSRILLARLLGMPLPHHRLLKLDLGHMAILVAEAGRLRMMQLNVDSAAYVHHLLGS